MTQIPDRSICIKTIAQGAVLRMCLTGLTFWYMWAYPNSSIGYKSKYFYLILAFGLTLLDFTDNTFSRLYSLTLGSFRDRCTQFFEYQSTDKINDLVSYILAWYIFDLKSDPLFGIFCILRAFGVIGFIWSKKSYPLMIFPDLLKEYLVYRYFIPQGFKWLPALIIGKIGFEIYFHSQANKLSY